MGTGQTCENFAQLPRPHDCLKIVHLGILLKCNLPNQEKKGRPKNKIFSRSLFMPTGPLKSKNRTL